MTADRTHRDVTVVTEKTADRLGPRELDLCRQHRTDLMDWALSIGKNPEKADGYAEETVRQRMYRIDLFYRFVWDQEGRFTVDATPAHADAWMKDLAYADHSTSYNATCQKAVKMLFKWMRLEKGRDADWDPEIPFPTNASGMNRNYYLSREERRQLEEAAMEVGSVPDYTAVTPEKRSEVKAYLAQRFEKPKREVTPDDWDRANSWKIPSLVAVTLDCGLRPKEVGLAKVSWIDWDSSRLVIPARDAVKSNVRWEPALRDRTVLMLERWVEERDLYDRYDGSDRLWLTRYGNPYGSSALGRLLNRLCDTAGLDRDKMTWTAIRRSTATYMMQAAGPRAAQEQLRHTSVETTARYDQAPVEDRKDALERMG